ncbi:MAG: serine hydrolase domain-containing protein [Pseudomonadota bacterium]
MSRSPPAWVVAIALGAWAAFPARAEPPVTGESVPALAAFDETMLAIMRKWGLPGGALAVARQGRLVLARGYGYADEAAQEPVRPDALFRIASLSKPVTAAAILRLIDTRKLGLDDKAFAILGDLVPEPGDPRLRDITVKHLLHHSGGWDRALGGDPMFLRQAVRFGGRPAGSCEAAIRYQLREPLDFAPGSRYAYSNLGYCVLGRIIERVSGDTYENFVRTEVLGPAGATRMRLGRNGEGGRAAGEVRYYVPGGAEGANDPYRGFDFEAFDAHGGWIASAIDFIRFARALTAHLLSRASLDAISARPDYPDARTAKTYYGAGWRVRPVQRGHTWWHTGSLPGTTALAVYTHHDMIWVALFNARPRERQKMLGELDTALWEAFRTVSSWPDHDLFERY